MGGSKGISGFFEKVLTHRYLPSSLRQHKLNPSGVGGMHMHGTQHAFTNKVMRPYSIFTVASFVAFTFMIAESTFYNYHYSKFTLDSVNRNWRSQPVPYAVKYDPDRVMGGNIEVVWDSFNA